MNGTASTSASTTPSAAMSMTPSAMSGPMLGNQNQGYPPTRRQTIGFARFKTRSDALAARELLQGRKVDLFTGATLKAEMAKKNLHTKRTTSGEELMGLLLRSGRLASLMGTGPGTGAPGQPPAHPVAVHLSLQQHQHQQPIPAPPPSARDAWDAWQGQEREPGLFVQPSSFNSNGSNGNVNANGAGGNGNGSGNSGADPTSTQSIASTSPPNSVTSPNTRPTDSKALLALAEEADELEGWSMSGAMEAVGLEAYEQRRSQSQQQMAGNSVTNSNLLSQNRVGVGAGAENQNAQQPTLLSHTTSQPQPILHHRDSSVDNTNTYQNTMTGTSFAQMNMYSREAYGTSPPGGSDQLSETGRSMTNPADQNPPVSRYESRCTSSPSPGGHSLLPHYCCRLAVATRPASCSLS